MKTWLLALLGLGAFAGIFWLLRPSPAVLLSGMAAVFFGGLVGWAEILSRYRDEPLRASGTEAGIAYLALNGVISLAAFGILEAYPGRIFAGLTDPFLISVVAGFGAMTVFRSRLFTFKSSDGKEYPIGPSIVLDTILKMIDSKIDRHRATERQKTVFEQDLLQYSFKDIADYIEASLLSFQNLSQEDRTQISEVIKRYRDADPSQLSDTLRIMGLGFAFLTLAGEENFTQVVSNFKRYIAERNQRHSSGTFGQGAPPSH